MADERLDEVVELWMRVPPIMYRKIHREVFRAAFEQAGVDISPHHLRILMVLREVGPLHMTEIGEDIAVSKPQMTQSIDRLISLGMVKRQPDAKDRRKINIGLTQKGRAINDACKKVVREGFEEKVSGLSEEELEEFADSLDRIREIGNRIFPNTGMQAQVV